MTNVSRLLVDGGLNGYSRERSRSLMRSPDRSKPPAPERIVGEEPCSNRVGMSVRRRPTVAESTNKTALSIEFRQREDAGPWPMTDIDTSEVADSWRAPDPSSGRAGRVPSACDMTGGFRRPMVAAIWELWPSTPAAAISQGLDRGGGFFSDVDLRNDGAADLQEEARHGEPLVRDAGPPIQSPTVRGHRWGSHKPWLERRHSTSSARRLRIGPRGAV